MGSLGSEKLQKVRVEVKSKARKKVKQWQKPTLEDVSEKIMAQPYIRFT